LSCKDTNAAYIQSENEKIEPIYSYL